MGRFGQVRGLIFVICVVFACNIPSYSFAVNGKSQTKSGKSKRKAKGSNQGNRIVRLEKRVGRLEDIILKLKEGNIVSEQQSIKNEREQKALKLVPKKRGGKTRKKGKKLIGKKGIEKKAKKVGKSGKKSEQEKATKTLKQPSLLGLSKEKENIKNNKGRVASSDTLSGVKGSQRKLGMLVNMPMINKKPLNFKKMIQQPPPVPQEKTAKEEPFLVKDVIKEKENENSNESKVEAHATKAAIVDPVIEAHVEPVIEAHKELTGEAPLEKPKEEAHKEEVSQ
jgi:hypothetical protein